MRLELTHDPEHDVWTLRCEEMRIETDDDVARWEARLDAELAKLQGHRVYLFVCLDGFHLAPRVAEAYGKIAKRVAKDHTLGLIRYGQDTDMTTTEIRVGAVLHRFPANIFADRRHALAALAQIRRLPAAVTP